MSTEYSVRTSGFHSVEVVISPADFPQLMPEQLAMVEQMVRELEIIRGETHQMRHRDFGRPVGVTHCVRVRPDDTVLYAKLKGRDVWGRFVFFRQPEPTSHMFINVKLVRNVWRLARAYAGQHAPAFPGDPKAAKISHQFWQEHALIWDVIPTDWNVQPVVESPWRHSR